MSVLDPDIERSIARALARGSNPREAAPHEDQATRLRELLREGPIPEHSHSPTATPALRSEAHARRTPDRAAGAAPLLTIASGKGGVGKTNLAVNLSIALAARGVRVALLDADLGTANADVLCGLSPSARLDHVLTSLPTSDGAARRLRDIAVAAPGGFRLIPGCTGVARLAELSPSQQRTLIDALATLEDDADLIIADAGAGIGQSVISLAAASDRVLVVTTPEPTAVADAYALIKSVCMRDTRPAPEPPPFSVVVNQCIDEGDGARTHARLAAVCERFLGISPVSAGFVAQDVRVPEAVRARSPLILRSPGCQAARNIQSVAATVAQHIGLSTRDSGGSSGRSRGFRAALARVLRLTGV